MTPAYDHGGKMSTVKYIVVHYTAGTTLRGAVRTLTAKDDTYVSAHVCVDRDGTVVEMVPFDTVAYHCGKSAWRGDTALNQCSIGVELVNPGYWREGMPLDGWDTRYIWGRHWYTYTEEQYAYVRQLHAKFPHLTLVGHSEIALPRGRKLDPGPAWDWSRVGRE